MQLPTAHRCVKSKYPERKQLRSVPPKLEKLRRMVDTLKPRRELEELRSVVDTLEPRRKVDVTGYPKNRLYIC